MKGTLKKNHYLVPCKMMQWLQGCRLYWGVGASLLDPEKYIRVALQLRKGYRRNANIDTYSVVWDYDKPFFSHVHKNDKQIQRKRRPPWIVEQLLHCNNIQLWEPHSTLRASALHSRSANSCSEWCAFAKMLKEVWKNDFRYNISWNISTFFFKLDTSLFLLLNVCQHIS